MTKDALCKLANYFKTIYLINYYLKYYMRSQGAIEYIIILGVIILIALIVVSSIGGFGIIDFSNAVSVRTNEISHLLDDVAIKYAITDKGLVQANLKSNVYEQINHANLTIKSADGKECNLSFGVVRNRWVLSSTKCSFLNGTVKEQFEFNCTVKYVGPDGIVHKKSGLCSGFFEEGSEDETFLFNISTREGFDEGTYENTSWGSVILSLNNVSGTYTSKIFDANYSGSWLFFNWTGSTLGAGTEVTPSASTHAIWHFNEPFWIGKINEVKDSSGNNNHATAQGNANTTANGRFNRGGYFDGNGDYINASDSLSLHPKTWSLEAWIKPTTVKGIRPIISYSNFYLMEIDDGILKVGKDMGFGIGWRYVYSNVTIPTNVWSHVAGTWNGSELRLYFNGALENINVSDTNITISPFKPPFHIGKRRDSYFSGSIDEVVIYSGAQDERLFFRHYRQGPNNITFQLRSCDDPYCAGEKFIGPDNTTNTYFSNRTNPLHIADNRYFQFKAYFSTITPGVTPYLYSNTFSFNR